MHRSGPHLRRASPISARGARGPDARHHALASAVPLRERSFSCATISARSLAVCRALQTPRCHNGCMISDSPARQQREAVCRQRTRVCGNREDAKAVLMAALLKAYRHLDLLCEAAAFAAWLAQIAKPVCWQLKERESLLLPLLQFSRFGDQGREAAGDCPRRATRATRNEATVENGRTRLTPARSSGLDLEVMRCRRSSRPPGRAEISNLVGSHEIGVAPRLRFGEEPPRPSTHSASFAVTVR
jgi:hypothetical protein